MDDAASLRKFATKCREIARLTPQRLSDDLLRWAESAEDRAELFDRGAGGLPPAISIEPND